MISGLLKHFLAVNDIVIAAQSTFAIPFLRFSLPSSFFASLHHHKPPQLLLPLPCHHLRRHASLALFAWTSVRGDFGAEREHFPHSHTFFSVDEQGVVLYRQILF